MITILGYDDCSNDPCPSGTTCLDTKDGFSCICPPWQDDCTYGMRVFEYNMNIIIFFLLISCSFKCWLFM